MINVLIKYKNNSIKSILVNGHANYADHGEDIVCAAVSAITQTTLLGLLDFLKDEITYEVSDGNLFFEIPEDLSEENSIKVDVLTKTLLIGLKNIKNNYNNYLYIKKEEV